MRRLLLLAFIVAFSFASNYVVNGDFEQPITQGWYQSTAGSGYTITRGTGYDPDPDYEAYLNKATGSGGHAMIYQTRSIPTTNIEFSVHAKMYAWDNHSSAWAGATVIIAYLDASNAVLGQTRICYKSPQNPWQNSPTMHIIQVYDSLWHDYNFNIEDELGNLSDVEPEDVKKIRVALLDTIYHC